MISGENIIKPADLTIKITDFEGPLDLLLHLIKKHEMDILSLPIAQVTEQYLDFIKKQQAMQLDVAAEYLVMAAKLIRIKSNDLLPQPEIEDELTDEGELDPKQELINRLLVYQRYQQATGFFDERQEVGMKSFGRPALVDETPEEERQLTLAPGLSLVDLQLAFDNVIARQKDLVPRTRQVRSDSYTIGDGIKTIESKLAVLPDDESLTFTELFDGLYYADRLVMTFLGLLEMSKEKKLVIWQADLEDEILIKAVKHERDIAN
ncbi:segregation and condensation protein A [Fructobacillus sp. CRL 2054]|uniref:segregation and condensation protein A n=1 Tax=Fructobacillus sp. CRL 2054 TaxID=2763007 RepID=UPI002378798F|nr:segregation/condensation protein A [Fructobacillus sp. CRL 2054]